MTLDEALMTLGLQRYGDYLARAFRAGPHAGVFIIDARSLVLELMREPYTEHRYEPLLFIRWTCHEGGTEKLCWRWQSILPAEVLPVAAAYATTHSLEKYFGNTVEWCENEDNVIDEALLRVQKKWRWRE